MKAMKLTPAQQRMIDHVRMNGPAIYNARATKTIETLERLELVTVDWNLEIAIGSNHRWRIKVTAKAK